MRISNVTTLNKPASASASPPSMLWRFASPQHIHALAGKMIPWFAAIAAVLTTLGLYIGFFQAPTDAQQGDAYRIIFLHVPAAWLSMFIYVVMAFWAALGLILNTRLSSMMARALAPTGALFTILALWTGALWGRPTWGTWWVWDARLTSTMLLLFLFVGVMALRSSIHDERRADRAAGILTLVGVLNVPIIYFSVVWWSTLHQGASVSIGSSSRMAPVMLEAMLVMVFAFWFYALAVVLARVRTVIADREADAAWCRQGLAAR